MCYKRTMSIWLVTAVLCCAVASVCEGASRVYGTLIGAPDAAGTFAVETAGGRKQFAAAKNASVMRGQTDTRPSSASLSALRAGDYLNLSLDSRGKAVEIRATYGIVNGRLTSVQGKTLSFSDGRKLTVHSGASVILKDGSAGNLNKLNAGVDLACRVNPSTGEAWTVAVSKATAPAPVRPAQATSSVKASPVAPLPPAAPAIKITSLTYQPTSYLHPGDTVKVELSGAAGGRASFSILPIIDITAMREVSPGVYSAQVSLPKRTIADAPLLGYLTVGNVRLGPVQAAKLVSVNELPAQASPNSNPVPMPVAVPKPVNAKQEAPRVRSAVVVRPIETVQKTPAAQPPVDKGIMLTLPREGEALRSVIAVRGRATPNSKVAVNITYSNGLSGLMRLAGNVASQVVAADPNGDFRMGPIALEGPLATRGLRFTVKASYQDSANPASACVTAIGDRT